VRPIAISTRWGANPKKIKHTQVIFKFTGLPRLFGAQSSCFSVCTCRATAAWDLTLSIINVFGGCLDIQGPLNHPKLVMFLTRFEIHILRIYGFQSQIIPTNSAWMCLPVVIKSGL
jgi:hypothetical protein